jgi:formylmethanofuran dehydrogenase subunit C
MKRGTIVAGRVSELPPSFRYSCDFRPSFLRFYAAKFREWHTEPPAFLNGEMRCYRGDLLHCGTGEVLTPAEPLRSAGTT